MKLTVLALAGDIIQVSEMLTGLFPFLKAGKFGKLALTDDNVFVSETDGSWKENKLYIMYLLDDGEFIHPSMPDEIKQHISDNSKLTKDQVIICEIYRY